jgi:hypothetical protein
VRAGRRYRHSTEQGRKRGRVTNGSPLRREHQNQSGGAPPPLAPADKSNAEARRQLSALPARPMSGGCDTTGADKETFHRTYPRGWLMQVAVEGCI